MKHRVRIPGVSAALEITEPGLLSAMRVELNGRPLERRGWLTPIYAIATDGGASMDVEIRWDGLRGGLEVKGPEFSLRAGKTIPMELAILALVPFLLAGVGGPLGGAMGVGAWLVNRQVALQPWPLAARATLMLCIFVVATLAWLVVGTATFRH